MADALASKPSFWEDILGSPRFISAPMVDMSELPFRMLCRRHGAQVCYTPMWHASQFLKDDHYCKMVFTTCKADRPLIVQFCANDKDIFYEAAKLVENFCDAVDLNLGCPQIIAKRGHYGAFLQDEWDLVTDIISYASQRLSIPVTCKIRILPQLDRSVQYAQRLEAAGAKLLTVHGRTREKKGRLSGLADWGAIRDIKQKVSIPVVANGNILTIEDVEDCLRYTEADAVMSAEGILHNPALFSGTNPPVWEIAEEFLELCESYPISHRHIRSHLFRIFKHCLFQYKDLQVNLAEADSTETLKEITKELKTRLLLKMQKYHGQSSSNTGEVDTSVHTSGTPDICHMHTTQNSLDKHNFVCSVLDKKYGTDVPEMCDTRQAHEKVTAFSNNDSESNIRKCFTDLTLESASPDGDIVGAAKCHFESEKVCQQEKYILPIWLCHSRPRRACQDGRQVAAQTSSSTSKEIDEAIMSEERQGSQDGCVHVNKTSLTKAEKKKKMYELRMKGMKAKRVKKREERKQRKEEQRLNQPEIETERKDVSERPPKRERIQLMKERCLAAMGTGQRVCIDLSLEKYMSEKECSKLAQQLCRLYGYNHQATKPMHIFFSGFKKDSFLYKECVRKNKGFEEYMVDMMEASHTEVFPSQEVVYLTPDSDQVLTSLSKGHIYVIGGLVDESVNKNVTQSQADKSLITTARLPINEFMTRAEKGSYNQILSANQVFGILLEVNESGDWEKALTEWIPKRKGFIVKTKPAYENEVDTSIRSGNQDNICQERERFTDYRCNTHAMEDGCEPVNHQEDHENSPGFSKTSIVDS